MAAMNLITSFLVITVTLIVHQYSEAAPLGSGGDQLTVRLLHESSGLFFAVINGNVALTDSDSDDTTLFKKTIPRVGYARFQNVGTGDYLLFSEDGSSSTYTAGPSIPGDSASGSGGSTSSTQSDWKVVRDIDSGDIVTLSVHNSNNDECYLAADEHGVLVPSPCDASLTGPDGSLDTYIEILPEVSAPFVSS